MANILFVAHGKKHPRHNPGYKCLKQYLFSSYKSTFVDINPKCQPTYVMDVTHGNSDFFDWQFDHIFVIFAHYSVLNSRVFWHNVSAWLKPGGMIHTVLPPVISNRKKDYLFGYKISKYTDLKIMPKSMYIYKKCPAIVMQKCHTSLI